MHSRRLPLYEQSSPLHILSTANFFVSCTTFKNRSRGVRQSFLSFFIYRFYVFSIVRRAEYGRSTGWSLSLVYLYVFINQLIYGFIATPWRNYSLLMFAAYVSNALQRRLNCTELTYCSFLSVYQLRLINILVCRSACVQTSGVLCSKHFHESWAAINERISWDFREWYRFLTYHS